MKLSSQWLFLSTGPRGALQDRRDLAWHSTNFPLDGMSCSWLFFALNCLWRDSLFCNKTLKCFAGFLHCFKSRDFIFYHKGWVERSTCGVLAELSQKITFAVTPLWARCQGDAAHPALWSRWSLWRNMKRLSSSIQKALERENKFSQHFQVYQTPSTTSSG